MIYLANDYINDYNKQKKKNHTRKQQTYQQTTDYHKTKKKNINLTNSIWQITQFVVPLQQKQNN